MTAALTARIPIHRPGFELSQVMGVPPAIGVPLVPGTPPVAEVSSGFWLSTCTVQEAQTLLPSAA